MSGPLTICSVSYHSGLHLRLNHELTRELNDGFEWLVVQNGPHEELPQFRVIDGVPHPDPATIGSGNPQVNTASYHHALGLNQAIPHVRTRFVLFLDPDFFVIPPLAALIDHMLTQELAFFGAPYAIDPARRRQQTFPCAFCLLVDTARVDLSVLDFRPDITRLDVMADTGYRVYERFGHLKHEIALPSHAEPTEHPHTPRSLAANYGCAPPANSRIDDYFLRDRLFGLHLHMKLHIHRQRLGKEATKEIAKAELRAVEQLVRKVRRHDSLV